jgi:hypothetical protein
MAMFIAYTSQLFFLNGFLSCSQWCKNAEMAMFIAYTSQLIGFLEKYSGNTGF